MEGAVISLIRDSYVDGGRFKQNAPIADRMKAGSAPLSD
jgi:hypothetical protein